MKRIRNFDLPFIMGNEPQYDLNKLAEDDIVEARYIKYKGYEDNPNICALPEDEDARVLFEHHTIPVMGYDPRLLSGMRTEEKMRLLFRIKEMRLALPFHAGIESNIHNALIRSYGNRDYAVADVGETGTLNVGSYTVPDAMRSSRNDLMSTPPAFSIIGTAGSGKTSAVLLTLKKFPRAIIHNLKERSYIQIPVIMLTAPANSNLKALFIQFGQKIDDILGGGVYYSDIFAKQTGNIGRMSNLMTEIIRKFSIGLIIIDEIQLMDFNSHSAKSFETFLAITANSGVGLCCIGTPDAMDKFAGDLRIYRRIAGITVKSDEYCADREYVKQLISVIWRYSFTDIPVPFSEGTAELIAEVSGGSIDAITTIHILIQSHALRYGCPEKMDTEYLRKLLSTKEIEKMSAMIRISREKNLKGTKDYRKSLRDGSEDKAGKEEAVLRNMMSGKTYGRAADKSSVIQSIMNVFSDYSEAMIQSAYTEAETTEGFEMMPVPDKTRAVLGILEQMSRYRKRSDVQKERKAKGTESKKSRTSSASNEELMESLREAAGGAI